jgi:integrase/recombinase XerD
MQKTSSKSLAIHKTGLPALALSAPGIVINAGAAAGFAWDEFFKGKIRNKHTRLAYLSSVRRFLEWVTPREPELARITPGLVGEYFDELAVSIPSKKVHLAAIRAFFDVLVQRHAVGLNPALSVRTERYSAIEGRTPEITVEQARRLLASIRLASMIDYRDRALIAVLIYTAARAGAIAKLRRRDLVHDGAQFALHFAEKGGKARSIPVRHDLQGMVQEYLLVAGLETAPKDSPLFRSANGARRLLTDRPLSGVDVCRMVKRRLEAAELPTLISPHSFRGCTATDLLLQGVPLDDVQSYCLLGLRYTTLLNQRGPKACPGQIFWYPEQSTFGCLICFRLDGLQTF